MVGQDIELGPLGNSPIISQSCSFYLSRTASGRTWCNAELWLVDMCSHFIRQALIRVQLWCFTSFYRVLVRVFFCVLNIGFFDNRKSDNIACFL